LFHRSTVLFMGDFWDDDLDVHDPLAS